MVAVVGGTRLWRMKGRIVMVGVGVEVEDVWEIVRARGGRAVGPILVLIDRGDVNRTERLNRPLQRVTGIDEALMVGEVEAAVLMSLTVLVRSVVEDLESYVLHDWREYSPHDHRHCYPWRASVTAPQWLEIEVGCAPE